MIKKVIFSDFLCFRNEEIEFDSGLNILIGPSGGGKTAVLEGILFGIFGFTPRSLKSSLNSLINENSRSTKVFLEILLNKELCQIERERTPDKTLMTLKVQGREVEGTLTDKFDKIAEVWGYSKKISKNSLLRAVYISREFVDQPLPVELQESWIMDLAEAIKTRILEKLRNLELQLSEIKGKISSLEKVLKDLEEKEALKSALDLEKLKSLRDILKIEKANLDSEIGGLRERIRLLTESRRTGVCLVCQRPLENLSFSFEVLEKTLKDLTIKKENLEKDLLILETNIEKISSFSSLKEEKDEILKSLQSLGELLISSSKEIEKFRQGKDKVEDLKKGLLKFFLMNYIFPKASQYASILFLGEEVRFRFEDPIEVKIGSGNFRSFFKLSTGEKIRTSISLKLASSYALSNLVKIPFLLIDEVFDSLDINCASELLKILVEEKSQIILTSHRTVDVLMSLVPSSSLFFINRSIKKL